MCAEVSQKDDETLHFGTRIQQSSDKDLKGTDVDLFGAHTRTSQVFA